MCSVRDTHHTHRTRRSFLSCSASAAAAFALSPALLRALAGGPPHLDRPHLDRPHLQIALEAWNWLDASRIHTGRGATWPSDPTDPGSTGDTLYTHGPGVLPFALELHHATDDQEYLDAAVEGAAHLAVTASGVQGAGLYTGLAGIAFVLAETWRATGLDIHRFYAGLATRLLIDRARLAGAGVAWPEGTGDGARESNDIISGTAGTGLGLLYLHRVLGLERALESAEAAGRRLLERAIGTETGQRWDMWPGYAREMPNFSHGTAGIAYFLATLHRVTGERDFLDAALGGARYLTSLATLGGEDSGAAYGASATVAARTASATAAATRATRDPGYRIFHSRPGGEDLYYLSWCHGPVGTNRLFYQLGEITGEDEWHDWVVRGARGVMATGIPERRTPGFWENISQCCGTAGVAEHFLTLHRRTGNADYRAFVDRLNDDLLGRSTTETSERTVDEVQTNETGRKWTQAEHRVQPELLIAQTGHMQGAAGVGKYFLHMDAVDERGEGPRVVFPDDPW